MEKNKLFYASLFLLLINFLYRLFDQAKMLKFFPLDYNNDVSSYMAQLYFLKNCGFHNLCSYWYNGFISFLHSPPGWYLFALPIFNVFNTVNSAAYLSIILMFLISFLGFYFLYGKIGFSKIERIGFFLFFFGNAIAIGNFIKLARVHELFAWMNFIFLFFIFYYFKDRKIDFRFLFSIPFYFFIILGYQSVALISSVLFLSLFLVKKGKERIFVIISFLSSVLLSAFWWLPFLLRMNEGGINNFQQAEWLWRFDTLNLFTNIFAFIIPLILLILFYIYYKQNKSRNNLFFYLPIMALCLLFFLRLQPFIPGFSNIFPDPYLVFFIFFIVFLFFNIDFNFKLSRILPYALIIVVILSVGFNVFRTSFFISPIEKENLELDYALSNVNSSFLILGDIGKNIHAKGVYSYAPTKYNISTAGGWYPEVKPSDYFDDYHRIGESFEKKECEPMVSLAKVYNITDFVSVNDGCIFFESCGLRQKVKKDYVCLYSTGLF